MIGPLDLSLKVASVELGVWKFSPNAAQVEGLIPRGQAGHLERKITPTLVAGYSDLDVKGSVLRRQIRKDVLDCLESVCDVLQRLADLVADELLDLHYSRPCSARGVGGELQGKAFPRRVEKIGEQLHSLVGPRSECRDELGHGLEVVVQLPAQFRQLFRNLNCTDQVFDLAEGACQLGEICHVYDVGSRVNDFIDFFDRFRYIPIEV